MNVSRFLLGMATVAFLMFNLFGCDTSSYVCNGDGAIENPSCNSTPADGGSNTGQDTNIDTSSSPDNGSDQSATDVAQPDLVVDPCASCTVDQVCESGVCVTPKDPCADWRWMEPYTWICPKASSKKLTIVMTVENGVCMVDTKIMSKKQAAELICNKEEKTYIFLEEQDNNKEFFCEIVPQ